MKTIARISGKKHEVKLEERDLNWTFERRPGGWILATRILDTGEMERVRFYYSRHRKNFFAKLANHGLDFFGERLEFSREGPGASSASDYTAQFPGKVRKVMVGSGDEVKSGSTLLMVEAMKMEFAIKAGSDGVVVKIRVEEGATLVPGQVLLDFEEKK
jgi:biotin carboxyl carrier protein